MKTLFASVSAAALLFSANTLAQAPEQAAPPQVKNAPAAARQDQPTADKAGPWSAEKLLDTKIRSPEGEELGEIEDLLVDDGGRVASVVVEVGGFLGIGERKILLPFDDLALTRDGEGNVLLKSNADKAKLESAPEYKQAD